MFNLFLAAICMCGVAPERADDFYWENDLVGFRAYGPGDPHVWSGFDLFNKMPDAGTTCGELLHNHDKCGNWHVKAYKGILDNYAIGPGRGIGQIALYGDGEWKTFPDWTRCEVIANCDEFCEFKLVYPAFSALGEMTCHITLKRGERFFKNTVSFKNPKRLREFILGPGLDVNPSRNHGGVVFEDAERGIVALYEDPRGGEEGSTATAVFIDPADAEGVQIATDAQGCRILALRKPAFTYYAGAAWSKAGAVTSPEAWFDEVKRFAASKSFNNKEQ